MEKTIEKNYIYPSKTILLETRTADTEFPFYDPNKNVIRVVLYDEKNDSYSEPHLIYVGKDAFLSDLQLELKKPI